MSTKHVRTTADLVRFGAGLRVDCDTCGRSDEFEAWDVARVFGAADLTRIQKRLKCSRCGARNARLFVLSPPERR